MAPRGARARPERGALESVVALGGGLVAVGLGWETHISGQWWVVLDMRHLGAGGRPVVLGHRVMGRVMDVAVVGGGEELLLLEGRGVLTRLRVARPTTLAVLERAYIDPTEPLFLQRDAAGRVVTPRRPALRAAVGRWIEGRGASLMRLDEAGAAR